MKDGLGSGKLRALIAQHLGVGIERVTDDAHFADDFGADWLDRVELVIAIEDQFAGVEILRTTMWTRSMWSGISSAASSAPTASGRAQ